MYFWNWVSHVQLNSLLKTTRGLQTIVFSSGSALAHRPCSLLHCGPSHTSEVISSRGNLRRIAFVSACWFVAKNTPGGRSGMWSKLSWRSSGCFGGVLGADVGAVGVGGRERCRGASCARRGGVRGRFMKGSATGCCWRRAACSLRCRIRSSAWR